MKKLWNMDNQTLLDKTVEIFETKDDILLDQKLVKYDVLGSLAHAKMLVKIGILTQKEVIELEKAYKQILLLDQTGKFNLKMSDEDIHTKIENYLVNRCGQIGKKIHTGRSRNDQVLTALRLFTKDQINLIQIEIEKLIQGFHDFSIGWGTIPMPGYTHMQKAMPSSIGMWAGSYQSGLTDDLEVLKTAFKLIDQSPLGSAAGYGSPLPLDRALTAKLLGFSKVQENPLYCQNSRGKFEAVVLSSLVNILSTLNKFASDILLFTTGEFGYFTVDDSITTGSSIMPQKKNIDIAELMRSKVHIVLGHYTSIVSLSSNLISGYNRDLQDSKKPLFESLEITLGTLKVAEIVLIHLNPNKEKLKTAMTPELFATEKALKLVNKGIPFREAYMQVKERLRR